MKFCAQLFFASGHLSSVALVIEAAQMQDAVQHKNLNFFRRKVSESPGISRCDFR